MTQIRSNSNSVSNSRLSRNDLSANLQRSKDSNHHKLVVIKLGGELLGNTVSLNQTASEIANTASKCHIVVVHGGGRAIDTELTKHGIIKKAVDGLRITDEATLDAVIKILAGLVNTNLVAAVGGAGAKAVGLTGADAAIGLVEAAPPHRSTDGSYVDLGFVGQPIGKSEPHLLLELCKRGYVPIVASIGINDKSQLFNVNADVMAAHLAIGLSAKRLIIAGSTPGVLDQSGRTITQLDNFALDQLIAGHGASAGMIAKLTACREAKRGGVSDVIIVDGRELGHLETAINTTTTIRSSEAV